MTRDEILNMPAGREMDSLVAKYIMKVSDAREVFFFSTDIYVAWEVVKKIMSEYWFSINTPCDSRSGMWEVDFMSLRDKSPFNYISYGDTAPLAICRAALLAVMENDL